MIGKLRLKIVVAVMVVSVALLTALFAVQYRSTREKLEGESVQMMKTIAARPLDPDRQETLSDGIYLPYFAIQMDRRGVYMATGSSQYDLENRNFVLGMMDLAEAMDASVGLIPGYSLRYYRTQSADSRIFVFTDTTVESAVLANLARDSLMLGSGCALVILLLAVLLAVWAVRPVEKAWAQQRQFVADASHELKTPLSVILTNAELLEQQAHGDAALPVGNILTVSRQMRELVQRLLELARADNGSLRDSFAPVDMSDLTREQALLFEPLCFEQGKQLHWDVQPDLWVRGSALYLRQAVEVLLDNACKYTRGNWIALTLKKQGNGLILAVTDPGEPLSREERKLIFKRFYRADTARQGGSFGLGLAIARSAVQEHRGRLWVESRQGVNTFYISLPRLLPPAEKSCNS